MDEGMHKLKFRERKCLLEKNTTQGEYCRNKDSEGNEYCHLRSTV